jgi:hypothetical protein
MGGFEASLNDQWRKVGYLVDAVVLGVFPRTPFSTVQTMQSAK